MMEREEREVIVAMMPMMPDASSSSLGSDVTGLILATRIHVGIDVIHDPNQPP
jgi:hypothetical protein